MNKGDLVDLFKETTGLGASKAKEVTEQIFGAIAGKLQKGEEVLLPGIGKLVVKERAARKGHNPKTGQAMDIPACKVLRINAVKEMKEGLNK